jgi:site-specific recombinase XerC
MADEWREWFDSWQLTLEVRGRRPRTIAFHERELLRFAGHVDTPPLLVTKSIVRQWMKDLIDRGLSAHTVGNRMVVIKSFYSWLVEEGEIPLSPAAGCRDRRIGDPTRLCCPTTSSIACSPRCPVRSRYSAATGPSR